jgi:hypothetical protein
VSPANPTRLPCWKHSGSGEIDASPHAHYPHRPHPRIRREQQTS